MIEYSSSEPRAPRVPAWVGGCVAPREGGQARADVGEVAGMGGTVTMKSRHGAGPAGRRMFEISSEETIELASLHGLHPVLNLRTESTQEANRLAGVTWTNLALVKGKASTA